MSDPRPLPPVTEETRPFWDACREGVLLYQHCLGCDRPQFYPRRQCARCQALTLDWRRSTGFGVVHSFTIVRRAPSEAFAADTPYVIALVDLDEGFRMMLNLVGQPPERAAIGQRVRVGFARRGEMALPQAEPA